MHNVWFAATVLGVATFASAQVVSLPQGTAIRVRLDQTLSSSTSKSGDTVRFEALDNVFADGKIAVARSAVVGGEIIDTKGRAHQVRCPLRRRCRWFTLGREQFASRQGQQGLQKRRHWNGNRRT